MGREVAVLRAGSSCRPRHRPCSTASPSISTWRISSATRSSCPGKPSAGVVECVLGRLRIRSQNMEGDVQVMIRPEQIRLAADGIPAEVVGHVYYGSETVVRLVLADGSRTPIVAKSFDQEAPAAGALVTLSSLGRSRPFHRNEPGRRFHCVRRRRGNAARRLRRQRRRTSRSSSTTASTPSSPQALVAAFQKQTGIKVNMRTNDSVVLADQLLSEGSHSPADVFISENSPEMMMLEQHGFLSKLDASHARPDPVARRLADRPVGRAGAAREQPRLRPVRCNRSRSCRSRSSTSPSRSGRGRSRSPRPTRTSRRSSAP